MSGSFHWRRTCEEDLSECLNLRPAKNGAEQVGKTVALAAWKQLLRATHATKSSVVEGRFTDRQSIAGFGLAVFVKTRFAESEVDNPRPGLNGRIIESIANRKSVVASYEEVRDENTKGDLQQVIMDTSWDDGMLNGTQRDEVRVLLGMSYLELFSGYHLSRAMTEIVGPLDEWHIQGHRSFKIVKRFDPMGAFAQATTVSVREDPGSVAAGLFHLRHDPKFAFTRVEQELLEAALTGLADPAIARSLFVSPSAIKRRWAAIFEKVSAVRPDMSPFDNEGGTRGGEKRAPILNYVRSHMEEIRPFNVRLNSSVGGRSKRLSKMQ
jgi:hypothetical protein